MPRILWWSSGLDSPASTAGDLDSIPGQGTKIPQAVHVHPSPKKKVKKKKYLYPFPQMKAHPDKQVWTRVGANPDHWILWLLQSPD